MLCWEKIYTDDRVFEKGILYVTCNMRHIILWYVALTCLKENFRAVNHVWGNLVTAEHVCWQSSFVDKIDSRVTGYVRIWQKLNVSWLRFKQDLRRHLCTFSKTPLKHIGSTSSRVSIYSGLLWAWTAKLSSLQTRSDLPRLSTQKSATQDFLPGSFVRLNCAQLRMFYNL